MRIFSTIAMLMFVEESGSHFKHQGDAETNSA
jgi:hypothetical protein